MKVINKITHVFWEIRIWWLLNRPVFMESHYYTKCKYCGKRFFRHKDDCKEPPF